MASVVSVSNQPINADWGWILIATSLGMTLVVNVIVTGLILFRIIKVLLEAEPIWYKKLGAMSGGRKIRSFIWVFIESAVVLFIAQAVLVVSTAVTVTRETNNVTTVVFSIHQMLLVSSLTLFILLNNIDDASAWLGNNTYNHTSAGLNGIIFP